MLKTRSCFVFGFRAPSLLPAYSSFFPARPARGSAPPCPRTPCPPWVHQPTPSHTHTHTHALHPVIPHHAARPARCGRPRAHPPRPSGARRRPAVSRPPRRSGMGRPGVGWGSRRRRGCHPCIPGACRRVGVTLRRARRVGGGRCSLSDRAPRAPSPLSALPTPVTRARPRQARGHTPRRRPTVLPARDCGDRTQRGPGPRGFRRARCLSLSPPIDPRAAPPRPPPLHPAPGRRRRLGRRRRDHRAARPDGRPHRAGPDGGGHQGVRADALVCGGGEQK